MKDAPQKLNIRYLGFENAADGGRRLSFDVTGPGRAADRIVFEVPGAAFAGANRITFQECASVCNEKLRYLLSETSDHVRPQLPLTEADILRFRPRKRRTAAAAAGGAPS